MDSTPSSRDLLIDRVRGLAIVTMIAANLAPATMAGSHPFWFRLYGSFAAPAFLFVSGYLLGASASKPSFSLYHLFRRCAALLLFGILVDVAIWQIYPLSSVDILYTIAAGSLITGLLARRSWIWTALLTIAIFLAAPLLRDRFPYSEYPPEMQLLEHPAWFVQALGPIAESWLVDGFFPLFPWVAFMLSGCLLFRWKRHLGDWSSSATRSFMFSASILTLGAGTWVWIRLPGSQWIRAGYSELFYPPVTGYCVFSFGLIGAAILMLSFVRPMASFDPLRILGVSSLAAYLMHLAIIRFVPISAGGLATWSVAYASLLIAVVLGCQLIRRIGRRWRPRMLMLRMVFGS